MSELVSELGEECIAFAGLCGVALDPTQQAFLLGAMATDAATSRWIARTVVDIQPRQNGKNEVIQARSLYGAAVLGEVVLHTAHQLKTCKSAFMRAMSTVKVNAEIYGLVTHIYRGNGDWSIQFTSGGGVYYGARTNQAGMGLDNIALIIYDESQEITREELAASSPTQAVSEHQQTWFAGSSGKEHSEVFWDIRLAQATAGHLGEPDLSLFYREQTAEICTVTPDDEEESGFRVEYTFDMDTAHDPKVWAKVNTGLRHGRISEDFFREQIKPTKLGTELFAREHLGVWTRPKSKSRETRQDKLSMESFANAVYSGSEIVSNLVMTVAMTEDESMSYVNGSGRNKLGQIHTETLANNPGTMWLESWLAERIPTHKPKLLAVSNSGPSRILAPMLARLVDRPGIKTEFRRITKPDLTMSCEFLASGITSGAIVHLGDLHMAQALSVARIAHSGAAWWWETAGGDVGALEAASIAAMLVETLPKRRSAYADSGALQFA